MEVHKRAVTVLLLSGLAVAGVAVWTAAWLWDIHRYINKRCHRAREAGL